MGKYHPPFYSELTILDLLCREILDSITCTWTQSIECETEIRQSCSPCNNPSDDRHKRDFSKFTLATTLNRQGTYTLTLWILVNSLITSLRVVSHQKWTKRLISKIKKLNSTFPFFIHKRNRISLTRTIHLPRLFGLCWGIQLRLTAAWKHTGSTRKSKINPMGSPAT